MTPTAEKTKSGKVVWRISYTIAGRRVRKSFGTREQARTWIDENCDIASTEGRIFWQAWRAITPAERHELMDSLVIMRELRQTDPDAALVDATKSYRDRRIAIKKSISFERAVQDYLKFKGKQSRKGKLSEGWLYVLQTCLELVVREMPESNKTLAEFTTDEIELWLDDQDWPPRTFNNYRDYIYGVFKWGVAEGFVTTNPVAKIEKYGKRMLSKEVVLPPARLIARVLELSQTPKYLPVRPALDLGMGLMMRSSEISRTEWSIIGKDVIRIPTTVGKYDKARNIHRSPLLTPVFQSLMRQHQDVGPVVPKGWRRLLTELFEDAGMGKPRNIMRKASSSCHYHATGDEGLTRQNMGHTDDSTIFGDIYKAIDRSHGPAKIPITKEDAKAHFALWKKC